MLVKNRRGREIEITAIGGSYQEPEILEALYTDNGEDISDKDLDYIYEQYADKLEEQAFQNAVGQAEYDFEGDR